MFRYFIIVCGFLLVLQSSILYTGAHESEDDDTTHNEGPSALSSLLQVEDVGHMLTTSTLITRINSNIAAVLTTERNDDEEESESVAFNAACEAFDIKNVHLTDGSRFAIAQQRNHDFLLSLNISSLACYFTSAANLTECQFDGGGCPAPGRPGAPICQPLPGEMGLGGYYGHYLGHWLSATAMTYANTEDPGTLNKAHALLELLNNTMSAWMVRYPEQGKITKANPLGLDGDGYIFPYDPYVFHKLEDLTLHKAGEPKIYSVPFYTLHKIMAGLLDQYQLANSQLAYKLVLRMADWVVRNVFAAPVLDQALWQNVLNTEWGGMNEVMFNIYAVSGNASYLHTGRRFNHWSWSAPLAIGEDDLAGEHANTHIPEIIGNMVGFELTANSTDRAIANEFFKAVTQNHSWATGGSNDHEYWGPALQMGDFLNDNTEESCTQYNILKVARHLLRWTADSSLGDFYERALLNGIIGNQNQKDSPNMTQFIYMLPLGGGGLKKPWGDSNKDFPCCWGTLSESFAKLSDSIFFRTPSNDEIFVNLFVSSAVHWQEQSAIISQTAEFPESTVSTTSLEIAATTSSSSFGNFSISIRVPSWATKGPNSISINQKPVVTQVMEGTWCQLNPYHELGRAWQDGDVIQVYFPMELWSLNVQDERPQYNATVAFLYGPLVLAGLSSTNKLVPANGGTDVIHSPSKFMNRVQSQDTLAFEGHFSTIGNFSDIVVSFKPLMDITSEAYTVYLDCKGVEEILYSKIGAVVPSLTSNDFEFSGGATMSNAPADPGCASSKLEVHYPQFNDCRSIRSGNPGQTSTVTLSHALVGEGHNITAVYMQFRYLTGYSTTSTSKQPTVSLIALDAINGLQFGEPLYQSPSLGNYSYDNFTGYSPPIQINVTDLTIPNAHIPVYLALQFVNNDRNLNLPIDKDGFRLEIQWS